MTRSDTYKFDIAFVTTVTIGTDDLIKLQSRTYYVGEKGEEISDYSENWTVKRNAAGTTFIDSVEKSSTIPSSTMTARQVLTGQARQASQAKPG